MNRFRGPRCAGACGGVKGPSDLLFTGTTAFFQRPTRRGRSLAVAPTEDGSCFGGVEWNRHSPLVLVGPSVKSATDLTMEGGANALLVILDPSPISVARCHPTIALDVSLKAILLLVVCGLREAGCCLLQTRSEADTTLADTFTAD